MIPPEASQRTGPKANSLIPDNINDRMRLVIEAHVPRAKTGPNSDRYVARGFWTELARATDVNSGRWRSFFCGHQQATHQMIEGIAKRWPEHAFWIATGLTDVDAGHKAPAGIEAPAIRRRTVTVMDFGGPAAHGD